MRLLTFALLYFTFALTHAGAQQVSVADFGADPTGVNDSAKAFREAYKAVAAADRGDIDLIFPTRRNLEALARFATAAEVLAAARAADPADASEAGAGTASTAGRLVRADSHRLGPAGTGKAVLVEFLDFECESCRAAYPVVEDLRAKYAGKVDFTEEDTKKKE